MVVAADARAVRHFAAKPFRIRQPGGRPVSALAWAVVALPAAGAAGLALMRQGPAAGWVAVGMAAATLALAAALPWRLGQGTLLRVDALAAHFAVLVALAGLLGAWFARTSPAGRHAAPALAVLAGLELAVLADAAPLAWAGLAASVLAFVLTGPGGLEARWRALRMVVPALALALLGFLLPGLANGPPGLLSLGWILLLAGLAPVAGLAPLHGWIGAAGHGGAAAALLPALGGVALLVLLRGQAGVMADPDAVSPGPPLVALGLASLFWAALGLWRDGTRPVRDAMLFQSGLAAIAFGLGTEGAIATGLLLLSAAMLLGPVAARGGPGHTGVRAGALAALALLPPFATFGAGIALLSEAAEASAWLALGLAALVAAGAGGLARAALAAWRAPGPRDRLAEIPAALVLALVVAAGVAPGIARWFAHLAEGL